VLRGLHELHPKASAAVGALPASAGVEPQIAIDEKDFIRIVRDLASNAASGPSGWTKELLLPLLGDETAVRALITLTADRHRNRRNPR